MSLYFGGLGGAVADMRLMLLIVSIFLMAVFVTYRLVNEKAALAVAALMGYIVLPLILELSYDVNVETPLFYAAIALFVPTAYFGLRGDNFDRQATLTAGLLITAYIALLTASYLFGLAPPGVNAKGG
ncbi:hypothetical protein Pogu_2253 [Pyrobaculum oguniense TE7]|uniref:Uncharacterized protein n=1 Tax=Pyrobaculum oguniense (strain DSM 13380 / JCM 10595 / TE7) TaxID=698757 RepID=H6QD12_PYROT|nr:hypothetical protein Pogu_2253 [Pyrobaculum oguniense TE7]